MVIPTRLISFIPLVFFFTLFSYLIFTSHASTQFSPSSASSNNIAIATEQIKIWSQNVENKMPQSILKKLSPLTKQDSDLFTSKITGTGFKAGKNFCSVANLACGSALDSRRVLDDGYNSYNMNMHIESNDPFAFFRLSALNTGNLFHLPKTEVSLPDRAFLPIQIASKLSIASIEEITKTFTSSLNKATKDTIEITLSYCNAHAIKGEIKNCPKSLEEMISFTKLALGEHSKLHVLTSESTKGSNSVLLIRNVKKFSTDKIVACHEVFLPFATYFCHRLSSTKLYQVDFVEPKTGAPVNTMLAICHMDTSDWPQNHVAFQILKFKPGEGDACHWFTRLDLAWIGNDKSV